MAAASLSTASGPPDRVEAMEFAFVFHQTEQHGVRSHAMREHWKKKRRVRQKPTSQGPRQLLPSTAAASISDPPPIPEEYHLNHLHFYGAEQQLSLYQHSAGHLQLGDELTTTSGSSEDEETGIGGIMSQLLTGINHALATSRLDPFDMFPVKLTAQHHKLLHHWLNTHATMMFEELPLATFNPMRDVWFPLDLSNAASFNAIMAHSAAHLARMQGCKTSTEALKYKAEAVRIVMLWMNDPERALSDEVLAAVIRLLTYARYWGTEAEWRVHREGLQRMVELRGGIETLRGNWRLELVTFLILLMSKPSWFDTSNSIREISDQSLATNLSTLGQNTPNLHRIRCLWLISFIQDMRNLTGNLRATLPGHLTQFTAVRDAISLLQLDLRQHTAGSLRGETCTNAEFNRVSCLFFISILLQGSISTLSAATSPSTSADDDSMLSHPTDFALLNDFLDQSRYSWQESVDVLHNLLFYHFYSLPDCDRKAKYVLDMTNVLRPMSGEARRGVERCLLKILWQAQSGDDASYDESWTPDMLLSSLHGL